jgi:hypothetical protein
VPVWGGCCTSGHKAEEDRSRRLARSMKEEEEGHRRAWIGADDARIRCPNPCSLAARAYAWPLEWTQRVGGCVVGGRVWQVLMDGVRASVWFRFLWRFEHERSTPCVVQQQIMGMHGHIHQPPVPATRTSDRCCRASCSCKHQKRL